MKGTHVVKDKVDGHVKPVTSLTPVVTSNESPEMRTVENESDEYVDM